MISNELLLTDTNSEFVRVRFEFVAIYFSIPAAGYDRQVISHHGQPGEQQLPGTVFIKPPFGMFQMRVWDPEVFLNNMHPACESDIITGAGTQKVANWCHQDNPIDIEVPGNQQDYKGLGTQECTTPFSSYFSKNGFWVTFV